MAKKKNAAQKAQTNGGGESTSFASSQSLADADTTSTSNVPLDALISTQTADETAQAISKASMKMKGSRVDILAASAAMADRDAIKVNNMNVTELKHACDDVLKKVRRVFRRFLLETS